VLEILRACDLFVFPSHWEGWGMAPAEACAVGAPVVATEVGFIADRMVPDRDYERVPTRDGAALTAAIRGLVTNPRRLDQLGSNGQKVVQAFRESVVRPRYVNLVRDVLAQR
jgi:glycosyltransferase involved in cell wall biosynthesis